MKSGASVRLPMKKPRRKPATVPVGKAGSEDSDEAEDSERGRVVCYVCGRRVVPMTCAASLMATTVLRAHPGFHLARVQDVQLFGGLFADEDTEVTLTMKRASAPDAAELEIACRMAAASGGARALAHHVAAQHRHTLSPHPRAGC